MLVNLIIVITITVMYSDKLYLYIILSYLEQLMLNNLHIRYVLRLFKYTHTHTHTYTCTHIYINIILSR